MTMALIIAVAFATLGIVGSALTKSLLPAFVGAVISIQTFVLFWVLGIG